MCHLYNQASNLQNPYYLSCTDKSTVLDVVNSLYNSISNSMNEAAEQSCTEETSLSTSHHQRPELRWCQITHYTKSQ